MKSSNGKNSTAGRKATAAKTKAKVKAAQSTFKAPQVEAAAVNLNKRAFHDHIRHHDSRSQFGKEKANAEWQSDMAVANAPKPADVCLTEEECSVVRAAFSQIGQVRTSDILCMSKQCVIGTLAGIGSRAATIALIRSRLDLLRQEMTK